MTEQLREILEELESLFEVSEAPEHIINDFDKIKEHITNLQQDLDKANDIIVKDRQFYKCRMDEYAELKKENAELNRMCELYSKSLYNAELTDYKSRCEKAIEYIMTNLISEYDIENGGCVSGSDLPVDAITPILDTLLGSDKNE